MSQIFEGGAYGSQKFKIPGVPVEVVFVCITLYLKGFWFGLFCWLAHCRNLEVATSFLFNQAL